MNSKAISFIKNIIYTFSSNLISLAISVLITLIVPKLINLENYGYWQIYIFYSSYIGFLHFGWNDGIYLRYGGKRFEELNKDLFFTQFVMLFILQVSLGMVFFFVSNVFLVDANKAFIFKMIAICMVIVNLRCMLLYILQGTNRIKEYALITSIDRVIYIFIIIAFLLGGVRNYKLLILADIIGKLISLFYAMIICKQIVFRNIYNFYFSFKEMFENISVGLKLMLANISSMLIIGVLRFGIERSWDVTTFGKVSLTLSMSNFLMVFINAVGLVLYPIIKRTSDHKLSNIYRDANDFLMVFLLGILILYYPFKIIMTFWLPEYKDSLIYMAILFPMFVYEGKMSLLINTYYKSLRQEKLLLKINILTLILSIIVTIISTYVIRDLNLAVMSIIVLLSFRCILSEVLLSRILNVEVIRDIILTLILVLTFILSSLCMDSWLITTTYLFVYSLYLIIKKNEIVNAMRNIKEMMKY